MMKNEELPALSIQDNLPKERGLSTSNNQEISSVREPAYQSNQLLDALDRKSSFISKNSSFVPAESVKNHPSPSPVSAGESEGSSSSSSSCDDNQVGNYGRRNRLEIVDGDSPSTNFSEYEPLKVDRASSSKKWRELEDKVDFLIQQERKRDMALHFLESKLSKYISDLSKEVESMQCRLKSVPSRSFESTNDVFSLTRDEDNPLLIEQTDTQIDSDIVTNAPGILLSLSNSFGYAKQRAGSPYSEIILSHPQPSQRFHAFSSSQPHPPRQQNTNSVCTSPPPSNMTPSSPSLPDEIFMPKFLGAAEGSSQSFPISPPPFSFRTQMDQTRQFFPSEGLAARRSTETFKRKREEMEELDFSEGVFKSEYSESVKRRRGKLPEKATSSLREWLFSHSDRPYPSEEEKAQLVIFTGLTLIQINNWFSNARRRILRKSKGTTGHSGSSGESSGSENEQSSSEIVQHQLLPPSEELQIASPLQVTSAKQGVSRSTIKSEQLAEEELPFQDRNSRVSEPSSTQNVKSNSFILPPFKFLSTPTSPGLASGGQNSMFPG